MAKSSVARKPGRKPGRTAAVNGLPGVIAFDELMQVKALVKSLGAEKVIKAAQALSAE